MTDRAIGTSRRGFAKAIAAAAAAAAAPAALPSFADSPAPTPTVTPTVTPSPTPAPPSSAAEALTEVVRVRWGKNLSGEQLGEIAKAIDGRLKASDAMKKVPLANGDEPDVLYSAGGEGVVP